VTSTVSTEVATRETPTPGRMVSTHSADIALVLPSHVKPETWVRVAQGALKRGKRTTIELNGRKQTCTELELAAANNPTAFMAAVMDAARLGLEPGTEQYYLTPRRVKVDKNVYRTEILGIIGYQGYIELMYRAGGVSTIVAECVYTSDRFEYRPGQDKVPNHVIDWDADDRGSLRLVYAYAIMRDGSTSKVVVLNKAAIETIKKSSESAKSEYSPWVKHEPSMWLKSAMRQLAKWVPTSAEYRTTVEASATAGQQVVEQVERRDFAPALEGPAQHGDDWVEDDAVDAELVDDPPPSEPAARPVPGQDAASITDQLTACGRTDRTSIRVALSALTGRPVASVAALTAAEAVTVAGELAVCVVADDPVDALDMLIVDCQRDADEQANQ
jgi:recombination protein RecT